MSVTPGSNQDDPTVGLLPNGRPDPRYALALGFVPAPALKRALAFAVDVAIWILLLLPGLLGTMPVWLRLRPDIFSPGWLIDHHGFGTSLIFYIVSQALLVIYGLVQLILHGMAGVTVGKLIFGLRTVRVDTFERPGFWRIVARAIIMWLAAVIVPLLGAIPFLLSPLWDSEKRGRAWHDKAVGAWMLDVRSGLQPNDSKGLRLARKALATTPIAEAAPLPSLATRSATGAAVEFVPSARSSSGVIAAHNSAAVAGPQEPWQPPQLASPPPPAPEAPAPAPSAVPAPAPAPAAAAAAAPVVPSTPPAGVRAVTPASAVFRFESGAIVGIDGTGLLGRNPHPQPGEDIVHLLPVADESLQISKTHAAFGVDDRGFWITDRGSSNGTAIVSPGGERTELVAGQRLYLEWGSSVEVGGRTFVVEQAQP